MGRRQEKQGQEKRRQQLRGQEKRGQKTLMSVKATRARIQVKKIH